MLRVAPLWTVTGGPLALAAVLPTTVTRSRVRSAPAVSTPPPPARPPTTPAPPAAVLPDRVASVSDRVALSTKAPPPRPLPVRPVPELPPPVAALPVRLRE